MLAGLLRTMTRCKEHPFLGISMNYVLPRGIPRTPLAVLAPITISLQLPLLALPNPKTANGRNSLSNNEIRGGAGGGTRTHDLGIMRPSLYP
jgi:hypothetical protein